eukprot:TRINITY_DN7709_c0_g1_i4.p1 TRINITY_DN7709_c0_g1~~TRINITY_DN7709_c0_g1_i4.p1  ORF type:complete len:179 (-),score=14.36 TRINITY_DN7709_c0_g1_i4:34-570(-)
MQSFKPDYLAVMQPASRSPSIIKTSKKKSILMMSILIFASIFLVIGSFALLIVLIDRNAVHHTAVVTGFHKTLVYIALGFTAFYGLCVYLLANTGHAAYTTLKQLVTITAYINLGLHLAVVIYSVVVISTKSYSRDLLVLVLLPSILEIVLVGLCLYSISNLFEKVAYFLIPMINYIN